MAKWCGVLGFAETYEDNPGVWKERYVEKKYYGDLLSNYRRIQAPDKVNDDIQINNQISLVANPYAIENFHKIRYATFMGVKWKVDSVEVLYPRLQLTLGGEFNCEQGCSAREAMLDSGQ